MPTNWQYSDWSRSFACQARLATETKVKCNAKKSNWEAIAMWRGLASDTPVGEQLRWWGLRATGGRVVSANHLKKTKKGRVDKRWQAANTTCGQN